MGIGSFFSKAFKTVKKDLAAVIIEPVAGNMGFIKSEKSFLELLRDKNLTKYAIKSPSNYESILDIDEWVRRQANEIARKKK